MQKHVEALAISVARSPVTLLPKSIPCCTGNLTQRVRFVARNSLLIVGEIGYLSIGSNGGKLFFQIVNACHEKCAIALTSIIGRPHILQPLAWIDPSDIRRQGRRHKPCHCRRASREQANSAE
ncbi:ATP-binding protein [Paraburkholderia kirstenboschensis]|uniref:ATP-binding protein n=1 Tax=Paraburkholderia kirstenboschensis TaxID=1245436 RepID=A0ABZ0EDQ8_9BURK|nr:ATP-binding protein [Paraburkholderia kirstenboschensis]WOD14347.1 ATP-binding protein [Paraburkholderia kirstenboschensis]